MAMRAKSGLSRTSARKLATISKPRLSSAAAAGEPARAQPLKFHVQVKEKTSGETLRDFVSPQNESSSIRC